MTTSILRRWGEGFVSCPTYEWTLNTWQVKEEALPRRWGRCSRWWTQCRQVMQTMGFSAMNNIITDYRSKLTTRNEVNILFMSSVGVQGMEWVPLPYVRTWMGRGRREAPQVAWLTISQKRITTLGLSGKPFKGFILMGKNLSICPF